MTITAVEKAIVSWITDQLQMTVDLYLGTDDTKGEILVRGIGLYEKNTFRKLLGYHAYRLLRERDAELQRWGRLHLSNTEIAVIISQVNIAINGWVKVWVAFTKSHSSVVISDITGKRSKVLLWIEMSEKTWKDTKVLIDEACSYFQEKYRGYTIYPFFYDGERESLESQWPSLRFVSAEDIRAEIMDYLSGKLSSDVDINMISYYIAHVVDNLCDISDKTIEDSQIDTKHKDIIKQKQQDFIDYVTQQVFSPKGYLYGNNRENVPSAISQNVQPSITDFLNFMISRGTAEAYSNFHLVDDEGHVYDIKDLQEVISLNERFVREIIVPEYQNQLLENDITDTGKETGAAFGYDIPSSEEIQEIYDIMEDKVDDIINKIDKSFYDSFSPEDLADWCKALRDFADEIAEEKSVDSSFMEPVTEAAVNLLTASTSSLITMHPQTITSTYKDTSVSRDSNRITGWKRYYPEGVTDTERISDWKRYYNGTTEPSDDSSRVSDFARYYPGVTDDSQLYANRVSGWQRYYPYEAVEEDRISDWKRYYPQNIATDVRVAGDSWQREYLNEGSVASDFLPTYRTFSGHDMVVTVQIPISSNQSITKIIGAFQTISYSIHNEKSPVRVLGDMNVRRFVFGPRMIAGSLILTVFDRHWMREMFNEYVKIKGETERYFLMDELPAMNITISCVNEYGHNAKLALYGVTIVNEGQIMSINDVYTENTYEFFALNIDYLDRVESTFARQKHNIIAQLPVDDVSNEGNGDESEGVSERIDSLEENNVEEKIKALEEKVGSLRQSLDQEIDTPDYQEQLNDIIAQYNDGKISQSKALSKINSLENKEKKNAFETWEDKVYEPAYKQLLSLYGVKKSDIKNGAVKNPDKLQEKLDDTYQSFSNALTSFVTTYDTKKESYYNNISKKYTDIRAKEFNMVVSEGVPPENVTEVSITDEGNAYVTEPFTNSSLPYEDPPITEVPY